MFIYNLKNSNICVWRNKWLNFNELSGLVIRKSTSEVNNNDWFILPKEDDSWTYIIISIYMYIFL